MKQTGMKPKANAISTWNFAQPERATDTFINRKEPVSLLKFKKELYEHDDKGSTAQRNRQDLNIKWNTATPN